MFNAIKFASYFELKHLETEPLEEYKKQEGFTKFVRLIEKEQGDLEPMSFDNYYHIVSRAGLIEVSYYGYYWVLLCGRDG